MLLLLTECLQAAFLFVVNNPYTLCSRFVSVFPNVLKNKTMECTDFYIMINIIVLIIIIIMIVIIIVHAILFHFLNKTRLNGQIIVCFFVKCLI